MRKFFLLMLLASAATPAVAQDYGQRGHRAERDQSDGDNHHQDRPQRQQRGSQSNDAAPRPDAGNRPDGGNRHAFGGGSMGNVETPRADRAQPVSTVTEPAHVERGQRGGRVEDAVRTPQQDNIERHVRKAGTHPTLPDRPEVERRNNVTGTGNVDRPFRGRDHDGHDPAATIEGRNVRVAPNIHEGDGVVEPRRDTPRVVQPTERRVSRRPVFGTEPPRRGPRHCAGTSVASLEHGLAARQPVRLAQLAASPSQQVPPRLVL